MLGFQGVKLQLWESKVGDIQCNPREVGRRGVFAAALAASMGEAGFPLHCCALALRECKDATDDLLYGHAMD